MVMLFLKLHSFEVILLFSLPTTQKGGHTPSPLKEETHVPTSNGFKRIMNLNCSFLLLPIRMGKSPTRIQK
jgi:hypothetical protein